jgi:predicted glycosyltransferase
MIYDFARLDREILRKTGIQNHEPLILIRPWWLIHPSTFNL